MISPAPVTSKQKSSARLYAVQAVYQMLLADQDAAQVVDDTLVFRVGVDPEMAGIERPAVDLFREIVAQVEANQVELMDVIGKHVKEGDAAGLKTREPLLLAILLAGAAELRGHMNIDAGIIINDYLDVTHSYYQGKESSYINGLLDSIKVLYRLA